MSRSGEPSYNYIAECVVPPVRIEPTLRASEARALSTELRGRVYKMIPNSRRPVNVGSIAD